MMPMMPATGAEVADPAEIKVLLVEDHAVLSQGLAMVLRQEGYQVATVNTNGLDEAGVKDRLMSEGAHLALLDLDLGAAGDARSLIPGAVDAGITVVVLTGEDDPAVLGECLEAGATAVLGKSAPLDEVVAAVGLAATGQPAMAATRREILLAAARQRRLSDRRRLAPFASLTPKEMGVLTGLVAGRSAADIAAAEYVSLPTVRSHIHSILRKLGVNSQVQAILMAKEAGWRARA
jgi:two-component system, NarL family, nitrate/nitrite response regulator NarL